MSKDDEDNLFNDLFDLGERVYDFIDENEDQINRILGNKKGEQVLVIDDREPLKDLTQEEDRILLTLDIKDDDGLEEISFKNRKDGKTVFNLNGKEVIADLPENAETKDMEVTLNNGVLEFEIPRGDE